MRPIDADALLNIINVNYEFYSAGGDDDSAITATTLRGIADVIKDAKTVEPKKTRGRWEYLDYGGVGNYHCTACRNICVNKWDDYAFCPHCGAEMGEQDEEG